MSRKMVAAVVMTIGSAALAEGLVVGTGNTLSLDVPSDIVLDAEVRVSDRAVVEKTGAGELAMPMSKLVERRPFDLRLREGSVRLVEGEIPEADDAADVLARAAFHLDASASASILRDENGRITDWLDVRESGDGAFSPFVRVRAKTDFMLNATGPTAEEVDGRSTILFGGDPGSGVTMNLVNPDGSQASVAGLRNVFVVRGAYGGWWGCVLGSHNGDAPHFISDSAYANGKLFTPHNRETVNMHNSRVYRNGREVDAFSTEQGYGFHLLEVECLNAGMTTRCLMNDRDYFASNPTSPYKGDSGDNRVGGGYVCEIVLFDEQLSDADRMRVQDALMKKWFPLEWAQRKPSVSVATSEGSSVVIDDGLPASVAFCATGDGTLVKRGERIAVLPAAYPSGMMNGGVRIESGEICGAPAVAVAATGGDRIVATKELAGTRTSVESRAVRFDRLEKTGNGFAALTAIPPSVSNLNVRSGTLALAQRQRSGDVDVSGFSRMPAGIVNGNFEDWGDCPGDGQTSHFADGQEIGGWHAVVPSGSNVFYFNSTRGDMPYWYLTVDGVDGPCSLAIKQDASVWTKVSIPAKGVYELSVFLAGRYGQMGLELGLMIGPDAEHLTRFGTLKRISESNVFRQYRFFTPELEPGDYQLWFKNPEKGEDICYQIDAVTMKRSAGSRDGVFMIPNGDFESYDDSFIATSFTLENAPRLSGWTLHQGTGCQREEELFYSSLVSYTLPATLGMDGGRYYNPGWSRGGDIQLVIAGDGSSASRTFRPPAGRWRLRASCGLKRLTSVGMSSYRLDAAVVAEGEAVSLGSVMLEKASLDDHVWPSPFTVDGRTDVTLTISGAFADSETGRATVDDLVLVRADAGEESLVADGSFEEQSSAWTVSGVSGSCVIGGDFFREHYGRHLLDGENAMRIVGSDRVWQAVTFAEGGLYRLSFHAMARNANGWFDDYSGNRLTAFVSKNGVDRDVLITDLCQVTNFVEWAGTFVVPQGGGTYEVGFHGNAGAGVDKTTCVDGVTVRRIAVSESDRFAVPPELRIDIDAGASLRLDYDGVVRVDRLRIGGILRTGVLNESNCPEAISGPGSIEVVPCRQNGLMVIVR